MNSRRRRVPSSMWFLLLLSFYPLVAASGWRSSSDVHACLELASSLLAITAGAMVLLHFLTTGRWFFLSISVGFVLIGAEEFVHAVFSSPRMWGDTLLTSTLAVSTTWLAGHGVLAASFFVALVCGDREVAPADRGAYAVACGIAGLLVASAVAFLIFNAPLLPQFVRLGSSGKILIELSLALLFLVASLLYSGIYAGQQSRSPLLWSIIGCLTLLAVAHIYVAKAQAFYDSRWDAAHLLVFLSSFFPIFGVWGETIALHESARAQVIELGKEMAERKRAEEKVRASEEDFRSLADAVPQIVWATRKDGWNIYYNRQWVEYTGLTLDESYGHGWTRPIHPDDRERAWIAWQEATEAGGTYSLECRLRRADGIYRWWLIRGVALLDGNGEVLKWFGTCTDVDDLKRAEEALREGEVFLRAAQRVANVGSWKWDVDTKVVKWSEELCRINGHDPRLPVPPFAEMAPFYTPEGWRRLNEAVARSLEYGEPYELELELVRPDGAVRRTVTRGDVERDASGRVVIIQGTVLDITDRKRAEEERARLEAQLQQAQKMESIGRLAGGVAHDFNNMLGVILGHTEMALEHVDPSHPLHADLEEIHKAASRSADLTRQLLAFGRRQAVAPRVLDLNETVAGTITMLQRLIGEDIHLSWRPKADLWPVSIDPSQVDQVMANLCVNARDAISGVGHMIIETDTARFDAEYCVAHPGFVPGEFVRLAVSDDGSGMDEETQAHIFEPFFTTKAMGKGTGLGLATVYGIVQQNDGFVSVSSEPGRGTTLTIYLPRHEGSVEPVRTDGPARPAGGHETILLVEDDLAILRVTRKMLEAEGYKVLAAPSPGEAIRIAAEQAGEIDLLLTDVVMPDMNGRELAEHLLSRHPHLTRLFTSGYTADVIAHHGVLDKGVHFIQKPFSTAELAAKVREALSAE